MEINKGDLVKVTTPNSMHTGKIGHVLRFGEQKTVAVRLNGRDIGFFEDELELMESTGRDGQIKRIRTILTQGDRGVWLDWDDTQSMAEDLYDAGLRFDADQ